MAKSGQIQLDDGVNPGDQPLADEVVFTESTPQSLGGVVADLLDASADPLRIVVDLSTREVFAFPVATDILGSAVMGGGVVSFGAITRDDATKRSSPVSVGAAADAVAASADLTSYRNDLLAIFAAQKPSKNVASIVNACEDALATAVAADKVIPGEKLVVVDQTGDGSVTLYTGGAALDPSILATLTVLAKVKQVPTSTTTGPAPLAFE